MYTTGPGTIRSRQRIPAKEICFAVSNIALLSRPWPSCRARFAGVGFWATLHLAGILQAFPETHRKEVLLCPS
jgi:hypothetical protein